MNFAEKKMIDQLLELKEAHGAIGVKAEFEAEGSRLEDLLRLKEISLKADLEMTVKIGGCEAKRDMSDAMCVGVNRLVAPMVETPFSLKKFLASSGEIFKDDSVDFFVNIETITACSNFKEMLELPSEGALKGVVIGRVDLTESLGLTRAHIDDDEVFQISLQVAQTARKAGLLVGIGGGISLRALPFLRRLSPRHIDFFETRKVILPADSLLGGHEAISKSIQFELTWLVHKRQRYLNISQEDDSRISMLQQRGQFDL